MYICLYYKIMKCSDFGVPFFFPPYEDEEEVKNQIQSFAERSLQIVPVPFTRRAFVLFDDEARFAGWNHGWNFIRKPEASRGITPGGSFLVRHRCQDPISRKVRDACKYGGSHFALTNRKRPWNPLLPRHEHETASNSGRTVAGFLSRRPVSCVCRRGVCLLPAHLRNRTRLTGGTGKRGRRYRSSDI